MDLVLWVFGCLLSLASMLLGIVYRQQQKRFSNIEKDIKLILERTDFVTFLSMDKTREEHWMIWRETLDKKLDIHSVRIERVEHKVSRIEGRMNDKT